MHPLHCGARSCGRRQLLRHVRRPAHLRPVLHRGARHSAAALRAHLLLPQLRGHGVAQDVSARWGCARGPVRDAGTRAVAQRRPAAAGVQPAGSGARAGGCPPADGDRGMTTATAPQFYPAFLDLRGRRVVVVGGGAIAEQKVLALVAAGARVLVVSPTVTTRLRDLVHQGDVQLCLRCYRPGDLAGAFLAIAATDDGAANRDVWTQAERRGIPLNAVDDLPHCSFIAPSVHRRGAVTIAVSTAGTSPALAVRLRER